VASEAELRFLLKVFVGGMSTSSAGPGGAAVNAIVRVAVLAAVFFFDAAAFFGFFGFFGAFLAFFAMTVSLM